MDEPNLLIRRIVRGWWSAHQDSWDSIPKPADDPVAVVDGLNSDRIIFIGDGPAMGFGVTSHDLALPGHLARQISQLTGRGVELHLIATPQTTAANVLDHYEQHKEGPYRAMLTMVGPGDAIMLTRVRKFRTRMDALLRRAIDDGVGRVLLVAIPPFSTMPAVPRVLRRLAQVHSLLLNRMLRELAGQHPQARFLPFSPPPESEPERHRTATTYSRWAALISPVLAELLDDLAREQSAES